MPRIRPSFPFVTLPQALVGLRVAIAVCFLAHAVVRVAHHTVPRFAEFLANKGLPFPTATVWAITAFELAGSIALAVGVAKRLLAAGFLLLLAVRIVLIHFELGWFVGEHGTGGVEYSFILMVALVVVAAE
jgi:putative oxidoreductase